MYTKRVQIINYGPIAELDITFPFDGDVPKPVVLVGANGAGKSILLSHIVNGLVSAKDHVYPETPEVETGKVFKLRGDSYIKTGSECYFAKVDFEDGLLMAELRLRRPKREYDVMPSELSEGDARAAWDQMAADTNDHLDSNILPGNPKNIEDIFFKNCVLYFPPNRFEEPAWLNEDNLRSRAEYMEPTHMKGYTNRRVISYSPLHDIQNWLFDVLYDRAVLETRTVNFPMPVQDRDQLVPVPIQIGPTGNATSIYEMALHVVQRVMKDNRNARFGIGRRQNRVVSLEGADGNVVPNIFQLSSGETSLLDLFLSILRDFDLSQASLTATTEVRGIAIVDEIDLHLHATHQHEILPSLMRMFPKVQFIVTTHSPLFVLGLAQTFGEDGFALYRMPHGQQISPEEFTEFGDAYQAFATTSRFSEDIWVAVKEAQSPILYMEGKTDIQYLRKAAELLHEESKLGGITIDEGGGSGGLTNIWRALLNLSDGLVPRKVMVLFDCEYQGSPDTKGNRFKCKNPAQNEHPIEKGIENLFGRVTLEKALSYDKSFINVEPGGPGILGGEEVWVQEKWTVNEKQKVALCDWLSENGSADDFQHFQLIIDLITEALGGQEVVQSCNSA